MATQNDKSFTLPGGFTVSGAIDEQRRILEARGRFAEKYAVEKEWDINNLSMEQLLEIRKQPDWKNPR